MKAVNRKALPQATTDLNLARRNLDQFGYCLLENALDADRVEALRQRLVEQADAEQELGRATFDAGPSGRGVNQRIWFLTNKGQVFRDLPVHPWARELVGHLLGDQYLLSSMTANIVKAGGTIGWHVDQWWFPGPVERNSDYLRPGSFTKQQFRDRDFHEEDIPGSPLIAPAVACNVAWMISDYSEENGATLVVPGSHLWGPAASRQREPRRRGGVADRPGRNGCGIRRPHLAQHRGKRRAQRPTRYPELLLCRPTSATGKLLCRSRPGGSGERLGGAAGPARLQNLSRVRPNREPRSRHYWPRRKGFGGTKKNIDK